MNTLKLMATLTHASIKHGFEFLYLGTVSTLHAAQKFYQKYRFKSIEIEDLPKSFEICPLDTKFFKCHVSDLRDALNWRSL